MKFFTSKFLYTLVIMVVVALILPLESVAVPPPPPPPPGGGPPCWPPPCVPINKGLIFLAISAFILAVYQLKVFRVKTK